MERLQMITQDELEQIALKVEAYEFVKPNSDNPLFVAMYNAMNQAKRELASVVRGLR